MIKESIPKISKKWQNLYLVRSSLQELDDGPHRGPYLLVMINTEIFTSILTDRDTSEYYYSIVRSIARSIVRKVTRPLPALPRPSAKVER